MKAGLQLSSCDSETKKLFYNGRVRRIGPAGSVVKQDYSLNLSILFSEGGVTKRDSLSSGERSENIPQCEVSTLLSPCALFCMQ